ncbi:MAG: dTMP kinase [Pseudomonadota bacterium]
MAANFITLEGIEGVGKSTAVAFVMDALKRLGVDAVSTREPGGTPTAERIRALLLDPDSAIVPDAELLLMFAARAQHIREFIEPKLDAGITVVCDRFTDATFAYQGGGRGIDGKAIETLARLVHPNTNPDLTLLLDAPIEIAAGRLAERGAKDRFEREPPDFFERIRQHYLGRAQNEPQRFQVIDARAAKSDVAAQITKAVQGLYV